MLVQPERQQERSDPEIFLGVEDEEREIDPKDKDDPDYSEEVQWER